MSTQAQSYQYVGDGHTWIRLSPGADKTKVSHGEIIETNMEEKTLLYNGFKKVNFDAEGNIIAEPKKKEEEKAPAPATTADLTKAMMKAIAEKYKVEIPANAKNNAAILAILTEKITPEDMAAEVALAFPTEKKEEEKVA